jgi:hypothetical protein
MPSRMSTRSGLSSAHRAPRAAPLPPKPPARLADHHPRNQGPWRRRALVAGRCPVGQPGHLHRDGRPAPRLLRVGRRRLAYRDRHDDDDPAHPQHRRAPDRRGRAAAPGRGDLPQGKPRLHRGRRRHCRGRGHRHRGHRQRLRRTARRKLPHRRRPGGLLDDGEGYGPSMVIQWREDRGWYHIWFSDSQAALGDYTEDLPGNLPLMATQEQVAGGHPGARPGAVPVRRREATSRAGLADAPRIRGGPALPGRRRVGRVAPARAVADRLRRVAAPGRPPGMAGPFSADKCRKGYSRNRSAQLRGLPWEGPISAS